MVTLVTLRAYWRFLRVVHQFFPLIVAYVRDRRRFVIVGGRRQVDPETQTRRAEVLLDSLLTLGPTFIKLGQLLSTRPDVLPPAYIDVLSSLQDDVPPADWAPAREVIEAELGPVEERFDDFDTDAISGASLGQVYRATYEGRPVAVKVRRPGIEELVEADLRVIRWLLPVLILFIDEARAFSLETLADEFARTIRQEMDYDRERRVLERIRENFAGNEEILIPGSIPELSGPRVLTMEYLGGIKITDVERLERAGFDRTDLARKVQRAYLQMVVDDGTFHADPHPGNLAVAEDGAVIFYDFGMSGEVDPFVQEKIVEFYLAVANRDIDRILDTMIEMGTLSPDADRDVMANVMELAIADVRGEEIERYRVQQVIRQVEDTIYEFPLRLPRNFALILRVATVVEGVCVTLDPDFDFIAVSTEYLTEAGYREESIRKVTERAAGEFRATARSLFDVPRKLDDVLTDVERDAISITVRIDDENHLFDRLARRLVYGMFVAVGVLSTALLYSFNENLEAAAVAATLTIPVTFLLYRSFGRRTGLQARPQFTRQEMRRRRGEADARAGGGSTGLANAGDGAVEIGDDTVDVTEESVDDADDTVDVAGDATDAGSEDADPTGDDAPSGSGTGDDADATDSR